MVEVNDRTGGEWDVGGGGFNEYFVSLLVNCPVVWCGAVFPLEHLEFAIEGIPCF